VLGPSLRSRLGPLTCLALPLQEGFLTVTVSLPAGAADSMRSSLANFALSQLGIANAASGQPLPPSDAQVSRVARVFRE
jgi:hypothetical protein